VNDHDIGARQDLPQIESGQIIRLTPDPRISALEIADRSAAVLRNQALPAPSVRGFENADIVTPLHEFAGYATQKVRIPMVPVGNQGVREDYEAHAVRSVTEQYASAYPCTIRSTE